MLIVQIRHSLLNNECRFDKKRSIMFVKHALYSLGKKDKLSPMLKLKKRPKIYVSQLFKCLKHTECAWNMLVI